MQLDADKSEQPAKGGSVETEWVPENEAIPFFRWSARLLGVIVGGAMLVLFIAKTGSGMRLLRGSEIMPMALFGCHAIGMFLALKWERVGAALACVSAALLCRAIWSTGAQGRSHSLDVAAFGIVFIALLFFLPILLYVLCWWLKNRDRKRYRAGS